MRSDYLNNTSYIATHYIVIITRYFIWRNKLYIFKLFHCLATKWNNFPSSLWHYYVNIVITKWLYSKYKVMLSSHCSPFHHNKLLNIILQICYYSAICVLMYSLFFVLYDSSVIQKNVKVSDYRKYSVSKFKLTVILF